MAEWCTQSLLRDGSSFTWHQPRNNKITLSVHYFGGYKKRNTRYRKDRVTRSESHATWAQWVCSREENSAIWKRSIIMITEFQRALSGNWRMTRSVWPSCSSSLRALRFQTADPLAVDFGSITKKKRVSRAENVYSIHEQRKLTVSRAVKA